MHIQFQNLTEKIDYIHCLPLINEVGKTDNNPKAVNKEKETTCDTPL